MEGIKVPVSLEIVQSSITAVKNAIANLKPNSKNWETLQGILRTMEREADRLAVTMSKPFTSEAQFTQAEKSIDKMDEALSKASLTMSRLKFSDLKLTPEQQATFDALNQQLIDIQNQIKQFKVNAKAELQKGQVWDDIIKIDPNAATRTFDELLKVVRKKNGELQSELQKAQEAANDFQKQDKAASFTEKVFKEADPLSDAGIGKENFERFFMPKAGKAEEFQFKSGQKAPFYEWVKENFTLTDEQLEKIKGKSGQQVIELFRDFKEQALQKANETHETNAQKTAEVAEIAVKAASSEAAVNAMGEKVDQLATLQGNLAGKTATATKQVEDFKNSTEQAARGSQDFQSAEHQMQSALDQLRGALNATNADFLKMQRVQQSFSQMKSAVVNFMGFSQVLNLTKKAIKGAIEHIRELDTVMNGIAIVTDMSTGDLWNQVDAYSKMAQSYGVSIKGAYEVSQIYYQQGLETADVMTLTNETLKLAKISGLDYATTTDYMTTALRGFKIEMQDAARIVDVYSALAANTAVSQEELAVAMSKTASSMEGVGATFEEASAMIGTMVAVTRESATNIGSAMKSIASRYGELTKDPTKLVDEDGEAMAFNKVDAALQSVGISMKTVDGQFRNFTEVIIELGEKWDQLDSTQQRYIATQFAGNRQQSRFLALVSNVDMLKSNLDVAMNSEDTGTLQALKALDSIESKTEQVRVAYQQFYTTIGAETVWKGFLDGAKDVINTLNSFPKLFGKLPIGAIAVVTNIIGIIKSLGSRAISNIAEIFGNGFMQGLTSASNAAEQGAETIFQRIINTIQSKFGVAEQTGKNLGQAIIKGATSNSENSVEQLSGQNKIKYQNNKAAIDIFQSRSSKFVATDKGDLDFAYGILSNQMLNLKLISNETWESIANDPRGAEVALKGYIEQLTKEQEELLRTGEAAQESSGRIKQFIQSHSKGGEALQNFGSVLHMVSLMIDTSKEGMKTLSGSLMAVSGVLTLAGSAWKTFTTHIKTGSSIMASIPWMTVVTGAFAVINGLSTLIITPEEKLKELEDKAEELNNKAKQAKADYRILDNSVKKIDELREKRYESAQAAEEYQSAVDELASKFPELISGFDNAGNVIINTTNSEAVLAEARKKSAEAAYEAARGEYKAAQEREKQAKQKIEGNLNSGNLTSLSPYGFDINIQRYNFLLKQAQASNNAELEKELQDFPGYLNKSIFQEIGSKYKIDLNQFIPDYGSTEQERLISQIGDAYQELEGIENFSTEEASDAVNNLYNLLLQAKKIGGLGAENSMFSLENIDLFLKDLSSFIVDFNKYTGLKNLSDAFGSQVISGAIEKANPNAQFLTSDYAKTMTAMAIQTEGFMNYAKTIQKSSEDLERTDENIQKVDEFGNYTKIAEDFISHLSSEQKKIFDKMASDTANYSYEDFDIFNEEQGFNEFYEKILKPYYTNGINSIQTRIEENLKAAQKVGDTADLTGLYKNIYDILENIKTTTEEDYFNTVIKQFQGLKDKGLSDIATEYGNAAISLFNSINSLDGSLEKVIWNLISENGLSTIEGINSIYSSINTNKEIAPEIKNAILSSLDTVKGTLVSNVNLSIQSQISSLLETWKDTSDNLIKAMKGGVTLQEADELINKANILDVPIDTTDFQTIDNKLILTSEKFNEYWLKLSEINTKNTEEWQGKINSARNILDQITNGTLTPESILLDETALQTLNSFGINLLDDKYKTQSWDDTIAEINLAVEQSQTGLNRFMWYNQTAAKQLAQTWNWAQGNYFNSPQLDSLGKPIYTSAIDSLSTLENSIKEDLSKPFDKKSEERAILDQVYQSYDTLINDVLSKGLENINLNNYEGIINEPLHKNELNEALKGSYQNFIIKYAAFAGKSIDETNDLLLQAIQKDQEATSSTNLSKLQFITGDKFTASLEDLNSLAKQYDVALSELVDGTWNEQLGKYVIDLKNFESLAEKLEGIDNFQAIVQDSINTFFTDLNKLISEGLSGALKSTDVTALKAQLESLGITNVTLDFSTTAKGIKLAEKSAIALYSRIRGINALAAQTTFKNLADSMAQNNEHYKSIASISNRIKELQDAINKSNSSTTDSKVEQYKAELQVAKEILAVRSATQEDKSFDFMSNDIPGSQNNPLNFYSGMQKMMKTIADGVKVTGRKGKKQWVEGFIDYKDFYNIATELGDLAKLGGPIEVAGITLDGSMEKTAALIQKGAESLTTIDTGDLKVSLQAVGLDILGGANSLSSGVDKGMKEFAKSQIKMLDGAIAMLEAIVTMQSIGDSAADLNFDFNGDNIFDPSELFSAEGIEKANHFLSWIQKFSSVKIDGKSLGAALTELANKGQEGANKVFNFFSTFSQWLSDPNYDFTNFAADLQTLLNATFSEAQEIDIGKGVFSNLNISTSSMTQGLVERINKAYEEGIEGAERNKLIADIKKQNEKLGTSLENLFKSMPDTNFKTALNILSLIEESGKIQETKGKFEVYYGEKKLGAYKSKEEAQAALLKAVEEEYNQQENIKFNPEVSTISIAGSTEVVYLNKISDNNYSAEYHGVTYSGSQEEVTSKIKEWMRTFAEGQGSFTYEVDGGHGTVKVENGVEYHYIVMDDGKRYYESDGQQYSEKAFEAFLKEKGKSENIAVNIVGDKITVKTETGVLYEKQVNEDGSIIYLVDGKEYSQANIRKIFRREKIIKRKWKHSIAHRK